MGTELNRLIYASRWSPELWSEIGQATRQIVAVSIVNNRLAGITGMLLVHEGWFVQALEGGKPVLCNLMDRISRDPRHRDAHVLCAGAADHRAFADWNMSAVRAGPDCHGFLGDLGIGPRFDAYQLDGASAFRLMLALAEAERTRERAALGLAAAE